MLIAYRGRTRHLSSSEYAHRGRLLFVIDSWLLCQTIVNIEGIESLSIEHVIRCKSPRRPDLALMIDRLIRVRELLPISDRDSRKRIGFEPACIKREISLGRWGFITSYDLFGRLTR
jgi:hypothetical protein